MNALQIMECVLCMQLLAKVGHGPGALQGLT